MSEPAEKKAAEKKPAERKGRVGAKEKNHYIAS